MTLGIVLFAKDNTIVVISDKRVTEGTISMTAHGDMVQKIYKITNKCGLTIAGDSGTATAIMDSFLKEVKLESQKTANENLPVSTIAEIYRKVAVDFYTKWFKDMDMREWVENVKLDIIPSYRVLIAGFDPDTDGKLNLRKIIELSSYRRFAPVNVTTNFSTVGITTIAQYLLYRFYRDGQDENAVAGLGAFCIQETNSQDDKVGDDFQIASFSLDKDFQFYSDDQLDMIKERSKLLKTKLEVSLYSMPKASEKESTKKSKRK